MTSHRQPSKPTLQWHVSQRMPYHSAKDAVQISGWGQPEGRFGGAGALALQGGGAAVVQQLPVELLYGDVVHAVRGPHRH